MESVLGSTGALHLRLPVGGAAYRMPRKTFTPPLLTPTYEEYPRSTRGWFRKNGGCHSRKGEPVVSELCKASHEKTRTQSFDAAGPILGMRAEWPEAAQDRLLGEI